MVPDITVTKTGDALSKATDDITYTIEICNAGVLPVTRTSVVDALLGGNISGSFAASLAPGQCSSANFTYTVLGSDPDPLVNSSRLCTQAQAHRHRFGECHDQPVPAFGCRDEVLRS